MRETMKRPEVRQLLRDIASFRASLAGLRESTTLDERFCCLADAIESYGWIGAGASPQHARSMLDAFRHVDAQLAAIDPEEPETAFQERLALWRVAERMGLLRRNVLGEAPEPIAELLYDVAAVTMNRYLRLGIAWSLYARRSGARELSLLFMALRDVKLYHLEEHYRIRHRQRRDANHVVLPAQEQQLEVERALEFSAPKRLGIPELDRDLRSLHALLRGSLSELGENHAAAGQGGIGDRSSHRRRVGAGRT
jgi:hypothetical protein